MRTLILMRHGHSPQSMRLNDRERPLDQMGKDETTNAGEWLKSQNVSLEAILTSPAARTIETTEIVSKICEYTQQPKVRRDFYLADPEIYWDGISPEVTDEIKTVLIVAHNPGIEQLAYELTRQGIAFHPSSIAVIDIAIDSWTEPLSLATQYSNLRISWSPY